MEPPPDFLYMEHMACRGSQMPWFKTKQFVRPDRCGEYCPCVVAVVRAGRSAHSLSIFVSGCRIHEHCVHYSIAKGDGTTGGIKEIKLNRTTEIRGAHLRSVNLGAR
jgi:MinD superfamily P-loop ATPase